MNRTTFISVDDEIIIIGMHRTSEHTFITKSPILLAHVPGCLNAESPDNVTSVFNKNGWYLGSFSIVSTKICLKNDTSLSSEIQLIPL